jgi:hypothetical protein
MEGPVVSSLADCCIYATIEARVDPIFCDFRTGCALILHLFPANAALAQLALSSAPHLAETLFKSGLITSGAAAIDMALAIQESRRCPSVGCSCSPFHERAQA